MHTLSFLMHRPDAPPATPIDLKEGTPDLMNWLPKYALDPHAIPWIVAVFICLMFLAMIGLIWNAWRRMTGEGEILAEPTEFVWLKLLQESGSLTRSTDGLVVFQHRKLPKKAEWWHEHVPQWSRNRLETILGQYFGRRAGGNPDTKIPDDVVTISIPRRHFRCGDECTKFEVRDGHVGYWSYQMLCPGVQVTLFHAEEYTFVAGVCIYLEDPSSPLKMKMSQVEWALSPARGTYTPDPKKLTTKRAEKMWCEQRKQWIVITRNRFGEIHKFAIKDDRFEPTRCSDCRLTPQEGDGKVLNEFQMRIHSTLQVRDPRVPRDCLDWVQVSFCERLKKPQLLALDTDGTVIHLNYSGYTRKYTKESCKCCQRTAAGLFEMKEEVDESAPPSFEYSRLIEVDETLPTDHLTAGLD